MCMVDVIKDVEPQSEIKKPLEAQLTGLTPDYAARILFQSYKHSQGLSGLQRDIFRYIHTIHPTWYMDNEQRKKVEELSEDRIIKYRSSSLHSEADANDIKSVLVDMQSALNYGEDEGRGRGSLVKEVTRCIVERDYASLKLRNGRPRQLPNQNNPATDPWLSFLVYYGLNGNTTHLPELDRMYSDVEKFVTGEGLESLDKKTQAQFAVVMEIYKQKHPGTNINL